MSGLVDSIFGGNEPDYGGMNQAAVMSAQLGQQAFNWFQQEYARTAPDRAQAQETANKVSNAQLAAMDMQNAIGHDTFQYGKSTFRPVEAKMAADAMAYDTPQRRQQAADQAVADVNAQAAAQRAATAIDLSRSGISPESGMAQSMQASADINTTRLAAEAAGKARDRVETGGWARMADVANVGRNLPSAQATAVSTGTNAGNAAVGAAGAGLSAEMSGAGLMNTGFNTALAGQGQAGKIFGDVAGTQAQTRGQDLAFMSSIFGSSMTNKVPSSPDIKKNRKVVEPAASMEGLRNLDIESWQYAPEKGGPDDGGAVRTGPMADAANEQFGDEVAPDGEMLNVASMVGVIGNAVKDIDKRLQRIEQRKAA
jgi:hypothetical protein